MTGPWNDNSNFWKSKEISTLSFIFLYNIIQKEVLTFFESCSEAYTWVMQKELQLTHKKSLKTILQLRLYPLGLNKAIFNYSTPEKLWIGRMFPEFGWTLRAVCEDKLFMCCKWDLASFMDELIQFPVGSEPKSLCGWFWKYLAYVHTLQAET